MVNFDYDCSGWATKANTKCYDGLTIAEDAFKGCSGQTVPMVYNHDHSSLDNVIGHALLENRKGGVYAYAKFNDTPTGQTAKKCVENGDLNAFSIWANGLQKAGQVVKHGVIRELSLVLAGCNPGALIQEVVKHSADNMDDEGCEAFIFNDPGSLSLEHGMDPEGNPLEEAVLAHSDDNKEDGKMAEETNGKTLEEVYNSMTDEQKECCHALVGLALEEQDGDGGEDDEEDETDILFDRAGKLCGSGGGRAGECGRDAKWRAPAFCHPGADEGHRAGADDFWGGDDFLRADPARPRLGQNGVCHRAEPVLLRCGSAGVPFDHDSAGDHRSRELRGGFSGRAGQHDRDL